MGGGLRHGMGRDSLGAGRHEGHRQPIPWLGEPFRAQFQPPAMAGFNR